MPVIVGMRLRRRRLRLDQLNKLACRILDFVGESQAVLSLDIIGDVRMRRLNRLFRQRDKTTDVLAFATREGPGPPSALLGDVVISFPQALRQSRRHQRGVDYELAVLLIHGILHLCGYDHERSEREARRMTRRERAVLRAVGRIPRLLVSGD